MTDDTQGNTDGTTADDHDGDFESGGGLEFEDGHERENGHDYNHDRFEDPEDSTPEAGEADLPDEAEGRTEAEAPGVVVPKSSYCEACPHFADPPTVACTNEGTEIAELVGRDHFRVVNCPVVEERAELED